MNSFKELLNDNNQNQITWADEGNVNTNIVANTMIKAYSKVNANNNAIVDDFNSNNSFWKQSRNKSNKIINPTLVNNINNNIVNYTNKINKNLVTITFTEPFDKQKTFYNIPINLHGTISDIFDEIQKFIDSQESNNKFIVKSFKFGRNADEYKACDIYYFNDKNNNNNQLINIMNNEGIWIMLGGTAGDFSCLPPAEWIDMDDAIETEKQFLKIQRQDKNINNIDEHRNFQASKNMEDIEYLKNGIQEKDKNKINNIIFNIKAINDREIDNAANENELRIIYNTIITNIKEIAHCYKNAKVSNQSVLGSIKDIKFSRINKRKIELKQNSHLNRTNQVERHNYTSNAGISNLSNHNNSKQDAVIDKDKINNINGNNENSNIIDDFEIVNTDKKAVLSFNKMKKLWPCTEILPLKHTIDQFINRNQEQQEIKNYRNYQLKKSNGLIENIPYYVEKYFDRVLIKIGPCDLAGVGGHIERERIIKDVVVKALEDSKIDNKYNYNNVYVSACVGVRGRLQRLNPLWLLPNYRGYGNHMTAYFKTSAGELTYWDPRTGPQRPTDDTICGWCVAAATSVFEEGFRRNIIRNVDNAINTFNSKKFEHIFDSLQRENDNYDAYLSKQINEKIINNTDYAMFDLNVLQKSIDKTFINWEKIFSTDENEVDFYDPDIVWKRLLLKFIGWRTEDKHPWALKCLRCIPITIFNLLKLPQFLLCLASESLEQARNKNFLYYLRWPLAGLQLIIKIPLVIIIRPIFSPISSIFAVLNEPRWRKTLAIASILLIALIYFLLCMFIPPLAIPGLAVSFHFLTTPIIATLTTIKTSVLLPITSWFLHICTPIALATKVGLPIVTSSILAFASLVITTFIGTFYQLGSKWWNKPNQNIATLSFDKLNKQVNFKPVRGIDDKNLDDSNYLLNNFNNVNSDKDFLIQQLDQPIISTVNNNAIKVQEKRVNFTNDPNHVAPNISNPTKAIQDKLVLNNLTSLLHDNNNIKKAQCYAKSNENVIIQSTTQPIISTYEANNTNPCTASNQINYTTYNKTKASQNTTDDFMRLSSDDDDSDDDNNSNTNSANT